MYKGQQQKKSQNENGKGDQKPFVSSSFAFFLKASLHFPHWHIIVGIYMILHQPTKKKEKTNIYYQLTV